MNLKLFSNSNGVFEANCQKSTGIDIGIAMGGSLLLIIRRLGGCTGKQ